MEIPDGGRHQIDDGSDQVPNCDICKEKLSDGYCGECETHMCQSCFDVHLNLKSCKYHVLSDQPTVVRKTHTEPCKIHENHIIEFVCVDHRKVGCAKCMLADHSACKREDINVAAKRFQGSKDDTRLSQNMQKVETMCTDCTQRIHHLAQKVAAANDKAVNDIDAFKASVIESIDETVRVALIKAERLRLENENQIEKRAVFLKKITNSMGLLKDSLKNREELEKVFIAAMDMEPKLAEYQEILSTLKTEDITAEYTFHPQKTILDMISDSRLLGEVIQDTDAQDSSREEDQPEQDDGAEQPIPKLIVTNIPSTVDVVYIEWFFERKKNFGGLDIQDVIYNEEDACAIVEFGSSEDVDAVLERVPIKMKGKEVEVQRYEPEPEEPIDPCTVLVSGPEAVLCDIETLEYYFESKRRSGGGDIADIKYDEDLIVVVITFEEEEDAQKVLERDHEVKGKRLTVESYVKKTVLAPKPPEQKADPESDEEIIYDTVKVVGVDPSKRSTVELYFENKRRSGGGEYQTIWSDEEEEGVIYIKYCSEEVAKNVASRSHKVEKCELKVKLYTPPKPPPSYDNKILIKGLKETTSQDGLFNFIKVKSGFIPESLDYHETEPGVVMVTFESKPDFNKLENIFQKYKLEGSSLKLAPVAISNCIMVSELPEHITQDTVHFYFENQRKSGGGDVDKVTMNDDDTCLVYFVDYTVIDNVLERKHILSKQTVVVQRYQECLGRPEGDVKDRKPKIPDSILLNDVDKNKVGYLNQSDTNRRTLEGQLQALHCKICWPNYGEDVRLDCTLTQSVDGCFRRARTWKKDVLAVVETIMGKIVVVKNEVLQDAWKNVIQKLGEVTIDDPESIALFVNSKLYSITSVGTKDVVTTLKTKIDSLMIEVMDEMVRQRTA